MADYKSTHTGAEIDAGIDKANTSDSNWSLLMANLGIGRWANQTFVGLEGWVEPTEHSIFYDDMAKYFTNFTRYWAYGTFDTERNIDFNDDMATSTNSGGNFQYCFFNCPQEVELYLPNIKANQLNFMFQSSNFTKILFKEGCGMTTTTDIYNVGMFRGCSKLVEIGEFDFSKLLVLQQTFNQCSSLKSIHIKHFKVSFDIHYSTAFEEADLVEIISNLDTVSTTQTLTMGATNLAKLTDAEKQVATDKGWVLA